MRTALDMRVKQPKTGTDDEDMDDIDGEQVGSSTDTREQKETPLLDEVTAITRACNEALSRHFKRLSEAKKAAIMSSVEVAAAAATDESLNGVRDLREFLVESGLSVPQLRSILTDGA
ncbi:hypothetical protein V3C99_014736 [Haemonchus contortus]